MTEPRKFWDMTKQAPIVERAVAYVGSGKALDLGSGKGVNAFYLAGQGFEVTAVDIDEEAIQGLKEQNNNVVNKVKIVQSNILDYSPDSLFDYIACNMVLHFLEKTRVREMVTKIQNMTQPSGVNVISVYTDKNEPGKRPYLFKTNELKNFYTGWEILLYDESPTMWFHMPGEDKPRRNHAAYLIARKLPT